MPNSLNFTPSFNFLTGSQLTIPIGAKSAKISVLAGTGFINGSGGFLAGTDIKIGGYDGRFLLSTPINVGVTGGNILVYFEV